MNEREHLLAADLAHVEHLRSEVLAFLDAHPDALLRSCAEGHLTASALVVDPDDADGRFVVLHHRKLGRWLQPGGHADGEADLAAVALREAEEETGLDGLVVLTPAVDLDVHVIPGDPPHLHLDLRFLVEAPPGSAALGPPPGNDESHELRWVTVDDLDALGADASLRRLATRR